MNLKTITMLFLALGLHFAEIRAQQSDYSPELWTVIENRWREFSTCHCGLYQVRRGGSWSANSRQF